MLADAGEGLKRTTVLATVRARPASTPYAGLGDLVGGAAVTFVGFAAMLGLRGRTRPAPTAAETMAAGTGR
jgi:hypothetical protein